MTTPDGPGPLSSTASRNGARPPEIRSRDAPPGAEASVRGSPPPVPSITVRRPRLEALLEEHAERRVILVRGPVGAGKTVLVTQWVSAHPDPCVWLSIDEALNDPGLLLRHLIDTVSQIAPSVPDALWPASLAAVADDVALRDIVASVTERLGRNIILVLDAVDRIRDPAARDVVRRLVERPPETVRLVLVSRAKPPLGLERARLRGDLLDLGPASLRFHRTEIEQLAPAWTGTKFDPAELEQETLGWAAGLRLAELDGQSDDGPSVTREPDGFAREYVREELVEGSPEHLRSFMEVTCWLPQLTGALCAALAGQRSGQPPLAMSDLEALPILPVPSRPGAFRYPPILTRALRAEWQRRSRDDAREALCRAAAAAQAAGELLTALELFLEADRSEEAAKVCVALATIGEASLRGMDELLHRRPELAPTSRRLLPWRVRAAVAAGHVQEATGLLAAGGSDAGDDPPVPDDADLLRARAAVSERRGDVTALLAETELLLAHDTAATGPHEVQALSWRVRALTWSGEIDRAKAALASLEERCDRSNIELALARAWIGWSEGEVSVALANAAAARHGEDGARAAEASLLEGAAKRERNQLAKATALLREAHNEATAYGHDMIAALAVSELARCQRAVGTSMDALEAVVSARSASPQLPYLVDLHLRTTEARVRLDRGDMAGAHSVVRAAPPGPDTLLLAARVAVAQESPTRATELLAKIPVNTPQLAVEQLLVQARLAGGSAQEPSGALLEAVAIGEPLGLIRTFLDEGPELSRQLSQAACEHQDRGLGRLGALARQELAQAPAHEAARPVEQLTARELAILRMLPLRMSNREMAAELYVSVNTLKTHVRAIYRKLEVPHRSAAVRRAKALQLV